MHSRMKNGKRIWWCRKKRHHVTILDGCLFTRGEGGYVVYSSRNLSHSKTYQKKMTGTRSWEGPAWFVRGDPGRCSDPRWSEVQERPAGRIRHLKGRRRSCSLHHHRSCSHRYHRSCIRHWNHLQNLQKTVCCSCSLREAQRMPARRGQGPGTAQKKKDNMSGRTNSKLTLVKVPSTIQERSIQYKISHHIRLKLNFRW